MLESTIVVSNAYGTAAYPSAALTVIDPPIVTSQPLSLITNTGVTVTFSVVAAGSSPFTYQWRFNGTNLTDNAHISGSQSSTVTLSNVQAGDAGSYSVTVVNSAGTTDSSSAALSFTFPYRWVTIAGLPGATGTADGTNAAARFHFPAAARVDSSGNIFVADEDNRVIRKITRSGTNWVVTTIAGSPGVSGNVDGYGNTARFADPVAIAIDPSGNLFVGDVGASSIRRITPVGSNWLVTTVAGGTYGSADGTNNAAQFGYPGGITVDISNNVYVADSDFSTIRKISPVGGDWIVTTIAGSAGTPGTNDGVGSLARFDSAVDLTAAADGNLFVADSFNQTIRKLTHSGANWAVTTIAGTPTVPGSSDGIGAAAQFAYPFGISADAAGRLYVSDTANNTIRKLTPAGASYAVSTIGGTAPISGSVDGDGPNARFFAPEGLTVDAAGNVFVGDDNNHIIREGLPNFGSPIIISGPTDRIVAIGSGATFGINATGSSLNYQWLKNGSAIPSATNLTYTVPSAQAGDAAAYSVIVSNDQQVVYSATGTLSVVSQPVSRNMAVGGRVAFFTSATGTGPFTYQWSHDSIPIIGATAPSLVLTNLQLSDAGAYVVGVTNLAGSVAVGAALGVTAGDIRLYETNLVVMRLGDGAQTLTVNGNSTYLDQYTPSGAYLNTVSVPDTGTNAAIISGNSFVHGFLSRSLDGRLLSFAAYGTNVGSGVDVTASSSVRRVAVTYNGLSVYNQPSLTTTVYTSTWRGVATDGTNNFWGSGGTGGTVYLGSASPSSVVQNAKANTRAVQVFNGSLYMSTAAYATADFLTGIYKFNGLPTTAVALPVPIVSTNTFNTNTFTGIEDFAINPANTIIYFADDRNFNALEGGLQRWDFDAVNNIWTNSYHITNGLSIGLYHLTVDWSGPNPVVFATTAGIAANSQNQLVALTDTGPASGFTVLATAGQNQAFRGVKFGPVSDAPVIVGQPQNQTNFAGDTAVFSVSAVGTAPLTYQWRREGTNLPGATSATLSLPYIIPSDAANYTVVVANGVGSVTSAPSATLTVSTLGRALETFDTPGTPNGPLSLADYWFGPDTTNISVAYLDGAGTAGSRALVLAADFPIQYSGNGYLGVNAAKFPSLTGNTSTNLSDYSLSFDVKVIGVTMDAIAVNVQGWPGASFGGVMNETGWGGFPIGQVVGFQHFRVNLNNATLWPTNSLNPTDGTVQIQFQIGAYYGGNTFTGGGPAVGEQVILDNVTLIINPPTITSGPQNQSVGLGGAASFQVSATGVSPLTYQWQINGTNLLDGGRISGSQTAGLTISNVNFADVSPNYRVVVSNPYGATTSSVANLSVSSTLNAYLKFDESSGVTAADATGSGWDGTLVNGPSFISGFSNNAVNLNSNSRYVSLPAGVVNGLSNFTIAAYVRISSIGTWSRIFDFGNGTNVNMFLTPQSAAGTFRFAITTNGAGAEQQINGTPSLPAGSWRHIAVTLNGTTGKLYVDGSPVGTNNAMTLNPSSLGSTLQNWIGRSEYVADPYLNAVVDEFRIYNVALNDSEVAALATIIAPSITSPPPNLAVAAGSNAVITAAIAGTQPIAYQWQFNGINLNDSGRISGSHSTALSITGVQLADQGLYRLIATNFSGSVTTAAGTLAVLSAGAPYVPIALTGFNRDIVIENTALPPLLAGSVTTATMDSGRANTITTWYERGFNPTNLSSGLPVTNSIFAGPTNHSFRMPPNYAQNNAILIDTNSTNGSFALASPAAFSALSFLASAANAFANPLYVAYAIQHLDGSQEFGTFPVLDWFPNNAGSVPGNVAAAVVAGGRVNVQTYAFSNVNSNNSLYAIDVNLANTTSPVTNILLSYSSAVNPSAHAAIFALSGAPSAGAPFAPVQVSGYHADMVAEAAAAPGQLTNNFNATMDAGSALTGNTWYERGYNPTNATTGLPAAGSTFTNATAPDRTYTMPASYAVNNAALIESNSPITITLSTPRKYASLSLLNASVFGTATVRCVATFADSSTETNVFAALDWFNNGPVAFTANGRVLVTARTLNNVNSGNPRLYYNDLTLNNTSNALVSLTFTWLTGGPTTRVAVFAVSGVPVGAPVINTPPQNQIAAVSGSAFFTVGATGDYPLSYQWQLNGGNISGATASGYTNNNVTLAAAGSYRVIVSQLGGAVTSSAATLAVITPPTIILQPANLQLLVGNSGSFSVVASSSGPLSYQWFHDGLPVIGATNATCAINNAQLSDSGEYHAVVSSFAGSISSADAGLLVQQPAAPPPPTASYTLTLPGGMNLIANQVDIGGNTLHEIMPVVPEGTKVSKYDNASGAWTINSYLGGSWVPSSITLSPGEGAFIESTGTVSLTFTGSPHVPVLPVSVPNGAAWLLSRQTNAIGAYSNIVGTLPAAGAVFYKWNNIASNYAAYAFNGSSWTGGSEPTAAIGEAVWVAPNGALPTAIPVGPIITQQPTNVSVAQGGTATFTVNATGTAPLGYIWLLNGNPIPGATSNVFTIPNVQPANAGNYSAVVTNLVGIANSTVASLTVAGLAPLPATDNFGGAGDLGSATNGTYSGNNVGATLEVGEPIIELPGIDLVPGGASVWLKWHPLVSGLATFTTAGSSFDTLLAVYTGNSLTSLTSIAADDDSAPALCSSVTFNAIAGATYYIQIEGYNALSGNLILSWNLAETSNLQPEFLVQPLTQTAVAGTDITLFVVVTNAGPTPSYQWYSNSIPLPGANSPSLLLSPAQIGLYQVAVTNTQSSAGVLSLAADVEVIITDAAQVGSPTAVHGEDKFALGAALTPPDPNVPHDPAPVSSYTGTQDFTTARLTADQGEPNHCGYHPCASKWFSYLAPASGLLTIDINGANFPGILEVYSGAGDSYASLVSLGCTLVGGRVSFAATIGTVYWVVVDGVDCATGSGTIHYNLSAVPAFTANPSSQTYAPGARVTLTANAVGATPIGYQWKFNGTRIQGATAASYVIPALQSASQGTYSVVSTNLFATNESAAAYIYFNDPARFISATIANGALNLQLAGKANSNYVLQVSSDLAHWTSLKTNKSSLGIINFTDPVSSSNDKRYYRSKKN